MNKVKLFRILFIVGLIGFPVVTVVFGITNPGHGGRNCCLVHI